MDVVYTYRDDKQNGTELRYSIRSMVKHFKPLENIVVVGDRPRWFNGTWIDVKDIPGPAFSIWNKIRSSGQTKPFLWAADDHFLLKDFDENFPNYHYKTNGEVFELRRGIFGQMLANSTSTGINCMVHCPMVMDPAKLPEMEYQVPIKTFYANSNNLTGVEITDCKFQNGHSYEQIKEIVKDRPFFSTSPFCMNKDMRRFLEDQYPNKSKYEI